MSGSYLDYLIQQYKTSGILVDTNLMLLLLVGDYNTSEITKFKRTRAYTTDDYFLLKRFVEVFSSIIVTPNILTEVSNLSGHFSATLQQDFFAASRTRIGVLDETYLPSKDIVRSHDYLLLGLTDAGIISLVKSRYPVITDDAALYNALVQRGVDALNINHFRFNVI